MESIDKLLVTILNRIITAIKGEKYKVSEALGIRDIFSICYQRCGQLVRGGFIRMKIRGRGIMFCGRRVKVSHPWKVCMGKGCIIGDDTCIDALSQEGILIGNNVTIAQNCMIKCTGVIRDIGKGIVLGNNVAVGAYSMICGQGGVVIGDDTIIGPNLLINAENHVFENAEVLIRQQGETRKGIQIGKNCWIGGNVIILDGVSVGDNCVIGAGSVVTRNIPENTIAVGVPAKVKGKRE